MSEDAMIQKLAETINKVWRKTTEGVLDVARLCADAEERLGADEKKKLHAELDFDKATFSKLVKIGSHPQLRKEPVKQLLPPNYTVVYKVALLPEAELALAIKEGVINPGMTRAELDTWIAQHRGESADEDKKDRPKVIATVQVPPDYDESRLSALQKALEKLQNQFGFSLDRPRDPETAAFNRMVRQMDDHIRKEARRFIAMLKSRKLQGVGKLTAAQKKKLWGYSDDETAIPNDASWELVEETLNRVGIGDQFERIRDEALRLYGMSEERVSGHLIIDHDAAMKELREATQNMYLSNRKQKKYPPEAFADWT